MNRQLLVLVLCCFLGHSVPGADDPFEKPPISYSSSKPHDVITSLEAKLASGALTLAGDEQTVVRRLLAALQIPVSSQMLVFSKTS
ncbi:MAG TPA: hypothetical protein VHI52_19405, partial [Verrucomicrobiae bacterium]|nr:hypothetical protein [Verrucomicrobiae bacterium]